jgi:hypothetical protein
VTVSPVQPEQAGVGVSVYPVRVEPSLFGAVHVIDAWPLSPATETVGAEGVAGTAEGTTPPTGPATEAALVPPALVAVTVKV